MSDTTTQVGVVGQSLAACGLDPATELATIVPDTAVSVYIELAKMREKLDTQLKEIAKASSALESEIIAHFQSIGQQRVTRNGRTLYLAREIWPKVLSDDLTEGLSDDAAITEAEEKARARLIDALAEDPDTRHLVKASYNHQTLRSFILNDCDTGEDGMPIIPDHLKGKLGTSEVFKAKVLKS